MKLTENVFLASTEGYISPQASIINIYCEGPLCQSGVIDDDKDGEGYGGENDFEW